MPLGPGTRANGTRDPVQWDPGPGLVGPGPGPVGPGPVRTVLRSYLPYGTAYYNMPNPIQIVLSKTTTNMCDTCLAYLLYWVGFGEFRSAERNCSFAISTFFRVVRFHGRMYVVHRHLDT